MCGMYVFEREREMNCMNIQYVHILRWVERGKAGEESTFGVCIADI